MLVSGGGAVALYWPRGCRWIRLNCGGMLAGGAEEEVTVLEGVGPTREAGMQ